MDNNGIRHIWIMS